MIEFRRAKAKYKKDILVQKRNSLTNYLPSVTGSGTFGSNYKIIKGNIKYNKIENTVFRDDRTLTDSYIEARSIILQYNF